MKIQESAENYLETIYVLSRKMGKIRSIDLAMELGYSKPTISITMKQYRENGLVKVDESGYIALTEKGMEIAMRIYERHQILTDLLKGLGVPEKLAEEDACRIEHHISPETFEYLKSHYQTHHKR